MLFFPKAKKKSAKNLGLLALNRSTIAIERLSRFRLFSGAEYTAHHPDTAALSPAVHFVGYGATERRIAVNRVHIARQLGQLAAAIKDSRLDGGVDSPQSLIIGIFVSSCGNIFMTEIAQAMARLMRGAGHSVVLGDENSDISSRPAHSIYVAPHEFFLLGRGPEWVRDDVLETACMFCTEQAQTQWFWQSVHIVLMAKSVIDLSPLNAQAFSEVMPATSVMPAILPDEEAVDIRHFRDHPLLMGQRWWIDDEVRDLANRPIDVCFFGTTSPHRSRFFSRYADLLSRHDGFLYLRTVNSKVPMNREGQEAEFVQIAQAVTRRSKVLLNVHRDEFPYFEWHRLVYQGMANGALVLSETCFPDPTFKAGIHYLSEDARNLPAMLEWVLNDPDGQHTAAMIVEAASRVVRDRQLQRDEARRILSLLTV